MVSVVLIYINFILISQAYRQNAQQWNIVNVENRPPSLSRPRLFLQFNGWHGHRDWNKRVCACVRTHVCVKLIKLWQSFIIININWYLTKTSIWLIDEARNDSGFRFVIIHLVLFWFFFFILLLFLYIFRATSMHYAYAYTRMNRYMLMSRKLAYVSRNGKQFCCVALYIFMSLFVIDSLLHRRLHRWEWFIG